MSLAGDDALSVDEILSVVTQSTFSPVKTVDEALQGRQDTYKAVEELRVRLDTYSQDVAAALASSLSDLQRAEKRLQYQVDLLKSDVGALAAKQASVGNSIMESARPEAEPPLLRQLANLDLVRQRITEVQSLLSDAADYQESTYTAKLNAFVAAGQLADAETLVERAEQIAQVFRGTQEEALREKSVDALRQRLASAISSAATAERSASSSKGAASATTSENSGYYNDLIGRFQRLTG